MLFNSVFAVFLGVVFSHGSLAALTPDQIVSNIGVVTNVSANLNSLLGELTTSTSAGQISTFAQSVTQDFTTIIDDVQGDITAMAATPPFDDSVTQPIVDALTEFVEVHQDLLATVIGKHGIFAQFALTAPIAAVLETLEATIDSFAFSLIDLIPTRQSDVTSGQDQLDTAVTNTINLYEQICIPSLLFPIVMPICIAL